MSEHKLDVMFNIFKVSELQRERVARLLKVVRNEDFRLWCFGSSVQGRCTPFSDLDLCIETAVTDLNEFYRLSRLLRNHYFNYYYDNNAIDVLYYNELSNDSIIFPAIHEYGVLLKDFEDTYV